MSLPGDLLELLAAFAAEGVTYLVFAGVFERDQKPVGLRLAVQVMQAASSIALNIAGTE